MTDYSDDVFNSFVGDRGVENKVDDSVTPAYLGGDWSAFKRSFSHDTLTGSLWFSEGEQLSGPQSDELDANFMIDDEVLRSAEEEGIRPEHLSELAKSPNKGYFDIRKKRILDGYQLDSDLRQLGALGTGMRVTNAVIDPASWAVAAGTGGLSKVESASRLGRIGKGALQAGVTEGAIATAMVQNSPTYDWDNAMLSTGAGFFLGGALSTFGRTQHSGMTPSESAAFDEVVSAEIRAAQTKKGVVQPVGGSGGAARAAVKEPQSWPSMDRLHDAMDNDPAFSYDLKVGGKSTRFDLQGRLGQSQHPLVRQTAFAKDAAGKEGGAVNPHSASEWKTREVGVSETRYLREANPVRAEYQKAQGWKFMSEPKKREFNEDVGRAVRNREQAPTPFHKRAADAAAREFRNLLETAKAAGVKGFDNIKPNDNYLPRIYNRDKFLRAETKFGTEGLTRFIAAAIRSGSGDVAAEEIDQVAKAYVMTLRSLRVRDNSPLWNGQGAEASREAAMETLKEELGEKISDDILEDVFDLMVPSPKDTGPARARRRLVLDETFVGDIQNASGLNTRFRLDDLLENDVEGLLATYRNTILGQSALARQGYASQSDFQKLLQDIRNTAEEIEGYTPDHMQADISRLEFLYNHVSGVPNHATGQRTRNWTERVLKYNFARVMNKTGFAQMSEMMLMTTKAGIEGIYEGVPLLKRYMNAVKNGTEIGDETMDLVEAVWGFGTKTMRGQSLSRFVDVEGSLERAGATKADDFLHQASNITAKYSGLGPMTDGMQLITARAAIHKWAKSARDGSQFMSKDRLAHLGIGDDMLERINKELKAHGTYKGQRGQDLPRVALSDWADMEAKDAFIAAVDRHTRRIIQENDIGQLAGVMTHPIARIMLQFRGFSIGSYTNHLLYGLNMKDAEAAQELFATMFGGLMGYSAAVYASGIGRDDRKEYMEKRLNTKAAAAAMVYRSSHAAFLPGMVDITAQAAGFDPIFGYARNTGLSTDAIFSNPTTDLAFGAAEGVLGTARAVVDPNYDFSQEQFDNLTRSLVFQNALGVQNILNITKAELPERPQ